MIEYIPGLKKGFTVILIVCLSVAILLLYAYNNSYFKNKFVISINDYEVNARYKSEFSEFLFIKNNSEGYIKSYSKTSDLLNEIPKSNKYILNIKEYEAYDKYKHRESYQESMSSHDYKNVNNSKNRLKIERMNEVLYDGDFINDVSEYITEEGRYYFHIYNKSKRTSFIFARVNTMFTFNVLVVSDED